MSDSGLGPWDPSLPHGVLTTEPSPAGTPGGIGEAPTPPGTLKTIDQAAINKAIADSQQGKPVHIDLGWLLNQPDSVSKQGLIKIVAILNEIAG